MCWCIILQNLSPYMGQVLSPMGAHSVSGDTAPLITEYHLGRPWVIERIFIL